MLKFDSKVNLDFLEQSYAKFDPNKPIDLCITKELDTLDFGLIPAIIQFFSRWHYTFADSSIIIDIDMMEDVEQMGDEELDKYSDRLLSEFYKLDYVFPVLVYCWSHKIEDNKKRNIKPLLKLQNEKQHVKMRKQTPGGGFKTFLSCFDQLGSRKGLLPAFYTDGEFIDNEMQFDYAIEKSIKKVVTLNSEFKKANYAPIHSDIVAVIYELVKNTDNWGKTDVNNKPIKPNTRGLYMKIHRRKRESFIDGFAENKGLSGYFSEENFQSNSNGELYFLELSVFDTGIGFIPRFTSQACSEYTTEEQVDILKKCLVLNNTSSTGIERHSKGKGLARIMRILNNKGLLWIRTGNISVFRNLIIDTHDDLSEAEDIKLFDWKTNSEKDFSKLSETKGAVITLVYPLINTNHV